MVASEKWTLPKAARLETGNQLGSGENLPCDQKASSVVPRNLETDGASISAARRNHKVVRS